MHITFGTSKRRKQWPIIRTKQAPGLKEYRQRDSGWKNKKKTVCRAKKIERPNTKWRFEKNLMVEVKIVEDPPAPLHVGAGRLPDWLRNKKDLLALVNSCADQLCIFRCIAVNQGAHPVRNTKRTRESATRFFDKRRVRQTY